MIKLLILYQKANSQVKKGNYLKAYYIYREIMQNYSSKEQGYCYYLIANLLRDIEDHEIIRELVTEVNEIIDQDRLDLINNVYFLFAASVILYFNINRDIHEEDKAEEFFKKANGCFARAEKLTSYKFQYINILLTYQMKAFMTLKRYDELVDRINQYLDRYKTFSDSSFLIFYKGCAFMKLGREKEAIEIYNQIYKDFTQDRYPGFYLRINFDLGKCYFNQSQFEKALDYFSIVKENMDRYQDKMEELKEIDNLIKEAEANIDT